MELRRITRQIHCKAVEQRATLIHRQYNRDRGTSYSRPPIGPYLASPCQKNPGGAIGGRGHLGPTVTRQILPLSVQRLAHARRKRLNAPLVIFLPGHVLKFGEIRSRGSTAIGVLIWGSQLPPNFSASYRRNCVNSKHLFLCRRYAFVYFSASEVRTLRRYTNIFIIIIIFNPPAQNL